MKVKAIIYEINKVYEHNWWGGTYKIRMHGCKLKKWINQQEQRNLSSWFLQIYK